MKKKHVFTALLLIAAQITTAVHAQNVDIQLRNTGSTLEVWLVPKANYTGVVTSLTFAISWNTAYNVDLAAAGTETVHVPTIPIQASGNATQTSTVNGTRKYRVYASGGGASSISLTNNAAFKIMSIPVPRTSTTPTGAFSISNDAFITANSWTYYFEMGGTDYTGNTSSIATSVPIPLELIAFNAVEKDNAAHLTWKTASEINFSHFDVERSGVDAQNWSLIGTVKSQKDAQKDVYTEGSYFLTDDKAFAQSNVVLYRLRIVNNDGSFKYSKVVSVQQTGTATRLKIYPNPVQNTLQLTINGPSDALQTVEIKDIVGKVWQRRSVNLLIGQNQEMLNVQSLPTGVYFLQMMDDKGVKAIIKFIKL